MTFDTSPYFLVNGGQDFHGLLLQASIGLRKYFCVHVLLLGSRVSFALLPAKVIMESAHCAVTNIAHSRPLHQSVRESVVGGVPLVNFASHRKESGLLRPVIFLALH